MIFTHKVMGFSLWKQFAMTPITVLPSQRSGTLKCLYLQHNYSIFVITPFKREIVNVYPRKNKTRQNKPSPTQSAFPSDVLINTRMSLSTFLVDTATNSLKRPLFNHLFISRRCPLQVSAFLPINSL